MNSIVVICTREGKYEAGRIQRFIEHMPPGSADGSDPARIAEVRWFKSPRARSTLTPQRMDKNLDCIVVLQSTLDDPQGNYWLCDDLVPCNVGVAPHPVGASKEFCVLSKMNRFPVALRSMGRNA